jgi:hypothetical protein
VLKITTKGFGDSKEVDLRKPKARKKLLGTDEPFRPEQFDIRVIKWDQRTYLMDEANFESFVDFINLGFEPRYVETYRPFYGAIYLREGDEKKDVVGAPSLPSKFLSMILGAPVTATILQIETSDNKTIATVDRGSKNGLRKDMTLVTESDNGSLFFRGYWVLSVDEQSAKVQVFDGVKVGDKLTTRVKDVSRYAQFRAVQEGVPIAAE